MPLSTPQVTRASLTPSCSVRSLAHSWVHVTSLFLFGQTHLRQGRLALGATCALEERVGRKGALGGAGVRGWPL